MRMRVILISIIAINIVSSISFIYLIYRNIFVYKLIGLEYY